jgi:hypothetical protein
LHWARRKSAFPIFLPRPSRLAEQKSDRLDPSPTGPQPVTVDPVIFPKEHPYDMDTSFPVLDVTNPNLQPWVVERLKSTERTRARGQPLHPVSSSCWPHGLPAYMRYNGPTFIIQSANEW